MAVSYLVGNELPTAGRMNSLWAEADTIVDKALDGKSTFMIFREKVDSDWSPRLYRGKEFWFYSGTHDATSGSVVYPIYDTMPTAHNQSTYDTAASGATIATYNGTNFWAMSDADINIDQTLKAHTVSHSGNTYFLWDRAQPAPEKKWRYAVAELVIGTAAANIIEFSNDYDKYNCFKIHNLTSAQITFYFGTSSDYNYSLTIPAYSQKCVRRSSVSAGYDSSYKYFFKCFKNDPRYLAFDSHDGSVAQTMRANNITNASYLYNIIEHVGGDGFTRNSVTHHHRIAYDHHVTTDIGSEYATGGYVPSITGTTNIGELCFTKGDISYYRAATTSSTPEVGTITFDGWGGSDALQTLLTGIGLSRSVTDDVYIINPATSYDVFIIWAKSTNLLMTSTGINSAYNVGSASGGDVALGTKFYMPPALAYPTHWETYQNRANGTAYKSTQTTVNSFWSALEAAFNGNCILLDNTHASGKKDIILTTEGPMALFVEGWKLATYTYSTAIGSGFNINNYYDIIDDGDFHRILVKQSWPLHADRYSPSGGVYAERRKGWPSNWTDSVVLAAAGSTDNRNSSDAHKYHRMFEGPRKVRRYETTTGNFPHLELTNDPVGLSGADFDQNDTAELTDTEISAQTCNIQAVVAAPYIAGYTDYPNYPRMFISDPLEALEDNKSTSTTYVDMLSHASLGSPNKYSRLNLLKEHYNDFVTALKKCKMIRPLCFDEIYFGNSRPEQKGLYVLSNFLAPMETYAGFAKGSATHTIYTNFGIEINDHTDAPVSDIHGDLHSSDQTLLENWRWVKIDDVNDKAAAMGFKFRFEEMVTPLKYIGKSGTYHGHYSNYGWFDITSVEADSEWKFTTALPIITGSTFMGSLTFRHYGIGNYVKGITATTVSNRAIKYHTYDTSRTASDMLKIAYVPCDINGTRTSSTPDFMETPTVQDENYILAPSTTLNYFYHAKVTPPVIHTA